MRIVRFLPSLSVFLFFFAEFILQQLLRRICFSALSLTLQQRSPNAESPRSILRSRFTAISHCLCSSRVPEVLLRRRLFSRPFGCDSDSACKARSELFLMICPLLCRVYSTYS
ncbi:hypothetical protein BGW80DRAFT_1380875 [Lactifluus volemus]|nr:hypothetical protein BGW80DRAFT_1380875 [Lactifluus volemus]